jgi:hypothetical protein
MALDQRLSRQGRRELEEGDGVSVMIANAVRCIRALLLLAIALLVVQADAALGQMPAAIAAPDATPIVTVHAEGAQIYQCKAGSDGKLTWAFREPIATLIADGQTVGRHYAGPTWEHADGSAVTGKVVANAPGATTNDIAWLKLEVVGRRGSGALSAATIVQRINTSGGALSGACDPAGALRGVPYFADYVFLRRGG